MDTSARRRGRAGGPPLHRTRVAGLGLDVVFCVLISGVTVLAALG